jgi:hypothetical protein
MKEMETQAANRKMAERGVEREREERKEEEVPVASAYRSTESGYKDKAEKDKTEAENENRRLVKKQWDKHPLVTAPYQGLTTKLMQCVVVREKSGNGMFLPSYSLYFQGSDQPAMIALLQGKNRTTNYHIFDMTRGILTKKLSKKSGNYLGKLRSNFSKTENILYTNDSRKGTWGRASEASERSEHAQISGALICKRKTWCAAALRRCPPPRPPT